MAKNRIAQFNTHILETVMLRTTKNVKPLDWWACTSRGTIRMPHSVACSGYISLGYCGMFEVSTLASVSLSPSAEWTSLV